MLRFWRLSGNGNEFTFLQYETLSPKSSHFSQRPLPSILPFAGLSCILGFTISSSFSYTTSLVRGIHNTVPAFVTIAFRFIRSLSAFPTRPGRLASCAIRRGDKPIRVTDGSSKGVYEYVKM